MADLRRIAANCAFEDRLEEVLRDRLVCGVNDTQIQRRLLAEPRLTLDTALGLAQAIEAAAKDSSDVQRVTQTQAIPSHINTQTQAIPSHINILRHSRGPKDSSDVQRVTQTQAIPSHINILRHSRGPKPQPTVSDQTCQRCGGSHSPVTCRFKNFTCRYCHKKGHLEKVCRSNKAARQSHNPRPQRDTNFVSENSASGTETVSDSAGRRLSHILIIHLEFQEEQTLDGRSAGKWKAGINANRYWSILRHTPPSTCFGAHRHLHWSLISPAQSCERILEKRYRSWDRSHLLFHTKVNRRYYHC